MLKRDYIMVLIEELGKAIAQMVLNRDSGNDGRNPELVRKVYHSLKVEPEFLLAATPEELRLYLNQDDGCGLVRMELAAKTLIEEGFITSGTVSAPAPVLRQRAKELLEYIQQNDTTFSLERVALLEGLKKDQKI